MKDLITLLREKQLTISSMESLTGGLFASELTKVKDASKVFKGGIVTYSNQAKIDVGKVKEEIINEYGAISSQTSEAMALNCLNIFESDIALSFTGNAGPSGSENKKVGLVYTTIIYDKQVFAYKDELSGSRTKIRNDIIKLTIERIKDILG